MRPVAVLVLVLVLVVVALAASPAPTAADGGWRISTLDAPADSRLMGLAARGDGRLSALLEVPARDGYRLVIRTDGRSRTLMRSRHSFEGGMVPDRRGRLTALWTTYPGAEGSRKAFAFTGGEVQQLTGGPGSVRYIRLTVHSGGDAIAAVAKGEQMLVARRGGPHGRFGPVQVLPDLAGAPNVTAAGGPFAVTGQAPGAEPAELVATVARRLADPFGPAVRLASPPPPPGTANSLQPAVSAFTADGALVVAYGTQHEQGLPPERRIAGSSVYAAVWPSGASAPQPPVELSRRRQAYNYAVVASGRRRWLTWSEGDGECCRPDALAAAPLVPGGLGPTVTRSTAPAEGLGVEPPVAAAEPGGGVRFYLAGTDRRRSWLHTMRLSAGGVFGAPERIAAGPVVAPPNHAVLVRPARGPKAGGAIAWMTTAGSRSTIRIARPRGR